MAQDYLDVDTDNGVRVGQVAGESYYAIHQFRDYVGPATQCTLLANLQSDMAPSVSPVVLQIYNYDGDEWETLDTEDAADADTDFELTSPVADLTNYRDGSLITCRIYQLNA